MKLFLRKLLALALGCLLLGGGLFAFVYNNDYNGFFGHTEDFNLDNPTGKMVQFRNAPQPNLIIGDSRMNELAACGAYVEAVAGEPFFNFGVGGASELDMVDLFWYCDSVTGLNRVYLTVSYYRMQVNDHASRVPIVVSQLAQPLTYVFSIHTLETTLTAWQNKIKRQKKQQEAAAKALAATPAPALSEEEAAASAEALAEAEAAKRQQLLDAHVQATYDLCTAREGYQLNERTMRELVEIAEYCESEGIELVFVALPYHPLVYERVIGPLGIEPVIDQYKAELSKYAPVYDMEFQSDFCLDAANFRDALHFDGAAHERFLHAMLTGDDPMVRILDNRETAG